MVRKYKNTAIFNYKLKPATSIIFNGPISSISDRVLIGNIDFSRKITIHGIFLPSDEIYFLNIRNEKHCSFTNSGTLKLPHIIERLDLPYSPILPIGSLGCFCVVDFNKNNVIFTKNIDTIRGNPLFSIQNTALFQNNEATPVTIYQVDLGDVKKRDIIVFLSKRSEIGYTCGINLCLSTDGYNWTIHTLYFYNDTENYGLFMIANAECRFIKIELFTTYPGLYAYARILKFYVFE